MENERKFRERTKSIFLNDLKKMNEKGCSRTRNERNEKNKYVHFHSQGTSLNTFSSVKKIKTEKIPVFLGSYKKKTPIVQF